MNHKKIILRLPTVCLVSLLSLVVPAALGYVPMPWDNSVYVPVFHRDLRPEELERPFEQNMHGFFIYHVFEVLRGTNPFPELSDVPEVKTNYLWLNDRTNKRHTLSVNAVCIRSRVPAEAIRLTVASNDLTLDICVLTEMDIYRRLVREYPTNFEAMFQCHLIVAIDYELERFVSRFNEEQAWTNTCKYTLLPLVKRYGASLPDDERALYGNWIESGGEPANSFFNMFLPNAFSTARPP